MGPWGKAIAWAAALWLGAGALSGQSLVEAARKEKARREAAKAKTAVVVTNADLSKARKKPALVSAAARAAAEAAGEEAVPDDPPTASAAPTPSAVPAPRSEAAEAAESAISFEKRKAELASAQEKAQERAELLDLKMRALNQQLYTFNSMSTKDQIQKSIAETYQKLLEARADATKAKEELAKFLNQTASTRSQPIWIKKP